MEAEASQPTARRVTTADVARASGVSRATVSYVLNDVPGRAISAATKEIVLDTARRLGHVPHGPARSLRLGRSSIVLALVRDYTIGYIADRLIEELDRALAARGYILMVHRYDENLKPLSELWGLVAPELIVSMGGLPVPEKPSAASPVKVVGVQGIFPHRKAGEMQVEYLHSRGHRSMGYAFLDNPTVALIADDRLEGARDACARLGLAPPVVQRIDISDVDSAFAAIDAWRSAADPITGVAAHNDETALILVSALQAKGLTAGTDLAVIGVDNIPLARIGITTVEINVDGYTEAIVERVMRAVDGHAATDVAEREDFLKLVVRDSA